MSVDCLKNFSLEDVRKARIDYTSSGSTTFGLYEPELLGERCTGYYLIFSDYSGYICLYTSVYITQIL